MSLRLRMTAHVWLGIMQKVETETERVRLLSHPPGSFGRRLFKRKQRNEKFSPSSRSPSKGGRGSVTPPMQSISLTLPAHCHSLHPPLQSQSERLLFISLQGSFVLSAVRNLIVWRRSKNGNGDIRNSRRTKTIIARHDDKTPSNRQSDHTAF